VVSVDELAVDRHLYGSVRMFMKSRSLFARCNLLMLLVQLVFVTTICESA